MALLDFFFPKRCLSCGKLGKYLCPHCLLLIRFIKINVCPVCERPAIGGAVHPGCQTRYSLDGLISFCVWEGPIKIAIHRLKYKPWILDLAPTLISLVVPSDLSRYQFIDKEKPIVVPVPLYSTRRRQRGFNQAALLAELLAKKLNLQFRDDILFRKKKTKPQAELKGKERRKNIEDAFALNPNFKFPITNYQFLLFDDIWTTGATLRTCGAVLKRAGAKKVWGLTIAR